MKTIHVLLAGMCLIGVLSVTGCYMESVQPTTYAVTPEGYVYEVDPYYNDFRMWVNADPEQCANIRTILVETRNQVIIDRRNAKTDREFTRLSKKRYQAANKRIAAVLTVEQRQKFKPHAAEFRSWVHAQREKPKVIPNEKPKEKHEEEHRTGANLHEERAR